MKTFFVLIFLSSAKTKRVAIITIIPTSFERKDNPEQAPIQYKNKLLLFRKYSITISILSIKKKDNETSTRTCLEIIIWYGKNVNINEQTIAIGFE